MRTEKGWDNFDAFYSKNRVLAIRIILISRAISLPKGLKIYSKEMGRLAHFEQ